MNRRRFLTMLGIAPVVAKAAPLLKALLPESDIDIYRKDDVGGWVSYKFKYTVTLPPSRNPNLRYCQRLVMA